MKKIISIFCICMMFLSAFQIAYAGSDKVKSDVLIKEEVTALNDQIKQNKDELFNLREKMSNVTISIQSKVAKLSSDKTAITQAKATDLKTVISIVKSSKKCLRDFKSDGLKQCLSAAKTARENKEFEQARDYMNKALELQEKRKQTLNAVISDLNTAEQLL